MPMAVSLCAPACALAISRPLQSVKTPGSTLPGRTRRNVVVCRCNCDPDDQSATTLKDGDDGKNPGRRDHGVRKGRRLLPVLDVVFRNGGAFRDGINPNPKSTRPCLANRSYLLVNWLRSSPIEREIILKSSSAAILLAAILDFSGQRPDYIGVQKSSPSLALCPPTPTCISTSEELNDPGHYVPPWSYNPPDGRGRKNPASKEKAMAELIEVVQKTKPDNYTPHIVASTDDYLYVEYESPLPVVKFVDDVEFWFPPGNRSIVEYRSASRFGQLDFDINRKRIKALRQALQKKGWESVGYY